VVTSRLYFLDTHERRDENRWVVRVAILVSVVALVCLGAGAAGFGCRGGAGDAAPPCGAVAAKFYEIAKHDLETAKVDDATARAVTDQLPAMRDALARACTEGTWSGATRKCLVHANDHAGVETCEQQLTDEQRRDLDRATRGNSETP
jgi:hypothetical protein